LDGCELIHISFDIDSLDTSISQGTGTPVPNGLTKEEAIAVLTNLLKSNKICSIEFTEVNPLLDNKNITAENAIDILDKVVKQLTIDN